jgi:hypothetical protein
MKFTKKDLETIFLENGIVSENPYKIIERLKSQNQTLEKENKLLKKVYEEAKCVCVFSSTSNTSNLLGLSEAIIIYKESRKGE